MVFEFLDVPTIYWPAPRLLRPLGGGGCLCSFKALADGQSGAENDTTCRTARTYQNDIVDIVLTK